MSRVSSNIVANVVGQGCLLVLGFVAVRYVFAQLGNDALGIIYFALTMSAVLGAVLELGVYATVVREVSGHLRREPGYIVDLLRTASSVLWCVYLVLAVTLWWSARLLAERWLNLATLDVETATRSLQVLGVAALVGVPRSLFNSVLRGAERMDLSNLIDVTAGILQQSGTVLVVVAGGGLREVVDWLVVTFALWVAMYLTASIRFVPWRAFVPGLSRPVIQRNVSFAFSMAAISVLAMIHTQADKLLVGVLLPLGTLGVYGVAYSYAARASLVNTAISQAVYPRFSALVADGDRVTTRLEFEKFQDLMCVVAVPLLALVPFSTLPLFTLLFTPQIAGSLLLPITLLTVGFYMNAALSVPYILSLALGRADISARSNLLALFVVLPLTAALVYAAGLVGAGLSWIAYHVFAYWYVVPRICSECLDTPARHWYAQVLRFLLVAGLVYGTAWLVVVWSEWHGVAALALGYVVASGGFLLIAYRLTGAELHAAVSRLSSAASLRGAR